MAWVERRRARRRGRMTLVALLGCALAVMTLDYRQGDEGTVAALQRGAVAAFAPAQEAVAAVLRPVGDAVSDVRGLATLRDRNRALEAEVDALRARQAAAAELGRENDRLRGLLGMRERLDYDTVAARVVAAAPSEVERSLLLDAGARDGLRSGQAVISAQGLVGRLTQVTPRYARVQLLSSPEAGYVVRLADSGEEGLLRGRGSRPFSLELLDPQAEAKPGARVVTRSFQGSTIVDGIPVGEVATADGRFLQVRPHTDLSRLAVVQVVLDAPAPPQELRQGRRVPADAPPPPPASGGAP